MSRRVASIVLSEEEQAILDGWARSRSLPVRQVQRAQIIQLAARGVESQEIARRLEISRPTVHLWRQRFLSLRLAGLEKDAPRPGRIPRISQRRVREIVHATLHTKPNNATHWSTRTMAEARGVSEATVRRIWKRHGLKPHLTETFKLSRDKRFSEKSVVEHIIQRYSNFIAFPIELNGERTLLMHGDSLCTQDVSYMKLRRWLRNPVVHKWTIH